MSFDTEDIAEELLSAQGRGLEWLPFDGYSFRRLPKRRVGRDRAKQRAVKQAYYFRCMADPVKREKLRAQTRVRYWRNREKYRATERASRLRRREAQRAYAKAYYVRNREWKRAYNRAYYKKNRERIDGARAIREAKKRLKTDTAAPPPPPNPRVEPARNQRGSTLA